MVIFYTLPPDTISYPYVLINANNPEHGIRYIMRHRNKIEAIIIDSGIEIFRNPRVKEYPGGPEAWIQRLVRLYDRVRSVAGKGVEIYVTCADYPDDYHHRALWLSEDFTNIERTVMNVLKCVDWYQDVEWLIPVQGWNRRPRSLLWSLEYLHELGVLKGYDYIAVANLCVELNMRILRDSVLYVYHWLKDRGYEKHRIHIFGLKIAALDAVESYVNSIDSVAWSRPVSTRLQRAMNWSAKTEEERILFFCENMIRLTRNRVVIPLETFEQCLDHIPRIRRVLAFRYRDRWSRIEKVLNDIESDLTTLAKL